MRTVVRLSLLFSPSLAAFGQETSPPETRAPNVIVEGRTVRHRATEVSEDPTALPASVTLIDKRELDRKAITTYGDIFRNVPGMWVNDYGQGGVANGVSMRGFTDGEHGRDVLVTLDGMPLNVNGSQHANGYVDLAQVIPELINRVEIVRGPFSSLDGNNAIAGSVRLYTDATPTSSLRLSMDSFGRARAVPIFGTQVGDGHLLVAAEGSNGRGYTDNSRAQRLNLFTRYVFPMLEGVGAVRVQAYDGDADAPGYLNRNAIESGALRERAALSPAVGDAKAQQNLVFNYRSNDAEGREGGGWVFDAYVNNDQRKRWTASAAGNLPGNPVAIRQEYDQLQQLGANLRKNTSFDVAAMPAQLTVGASFNRESLSAQRFDANQARQVTGMNRDRRLDTDNTAVFSQFQLQPVEPLKVTLGLRYDHFRHDLTTTANDTAVTGASVQPSYGIASPKAGVAYRFLNDVGHRAEVFANLARGFKTPWPFADFFSVPSRRASPMRSAEVGVQGGTPDNSFTWRAALWQSRQSREVFEDPVTFVVTDFGVTRRRGIDLEAQFQVSQATRLIGSYNHVEAKSLTATAGADAIPRIPDYLASIGLQHDTSWKGDGLKFSIYDTIVGPMALDPARTVQSRMYHRLTGNAAWTPAGWHGATVSLSLFVYPGSHRNLEETSFDFGGYAATSPKPPFRVVAGLTVPF